MPEWRQSWCSRGAPRVCANKPASQRLPDLIIAATAELSGATVLHYDEDYDRIAKVTGQPVEWVAIKGSL
jgi:predicted nucleic acid-binding protein